MTIENIKAGNQMKKELGKLSKKVKILKKLLDAYDRNLIKKERFIQNPTYKKIRKVTSKIDKYLSKLIDASNSAEYMLSGTLNSKKQFDTVSKRNEQLINKISELQKLIDIQSSDINSKENKILKLMQDVSKNISKIEEYKSKNQLLKQQLKNIESNQLSVENIINKLEIVKQDDSIDKKQNEANGSSKDVDTGLIESFLSETSERDKLKNIQFNKRLLKANLTKKNKHLSIISKKYTSSDKLLLDANDTLVISINPDLTDNFGHWKIYDTLIAENMKKRYNVNFISFAHKDCESNILGEFKTYNCFTRNTWHIGRNSHIKSNYLKQFQNEFHDAFLKAKKEYNNPTNIIIFMYCGSFNHAAALSEVIKSEQNINCHINTFWDHFNKENITSTNKTLKQKLLALELQDNLKLYADSDELNEIFKNNLSISFEIWPLFSLVKEDLINSNISEQNVKIMIFFPGKVRMEKGYDLTIQLANQLINHYGQDKVEIFVRSDINKTTQAKEKSLIKEINSNINLISGDLSERDFYKLFQNSDIIVLPYKKKEFSTRTSGLFCDSIYFSKPVVTTDETWLGNRVNLYANGVLFKNNDFDSLFTATKKVINNLEFYTENAKSIRNTWLKENTIDNLTKTLLYKFTSKKTYSILYYPAFESLEDFRNQYARMLWYLNPVSDVIDNIFIPRYGFDKSHRDIDRLDEVQDQNSLDFQNKINPKITYFDGSDLRTFMDKISESYILLNWNLKKSENLPKIILNSFDSFKKSKQTWKVDTENTRNEASFYSRVSMSINMNKNYDKEFSQYKFYNMLDSIRAEEKNKTYVFGTGPSLSEALNASFDFSDGISIACNSMVKNIELLDKLKPKVVVAADPIFHSGSSSYAGAFRKDLLYALDRYDAFFVVPFRDYKIYTENLPKEYSDKIIGIPFEREEGVCLDLSRNYFVYPYPNILTLFMIPLACTFGKEVCIMGCDGRKLEDNQYFWSHDKNSQFNSKMDEIKKAHPAFFKIDYNDYYLQHIEDLKNVINIGQENGKVFKNLTKSYIPILEEISELKIS